MIVFNWTFFWNLVNIGIFAFIENLDDIIVIYINGDREKVYYPNNDAENQGKNDDLASFRIVGEYLNGSWVLCYPSM